MKTIVKHNSQCIHEFPYGYFDLIFLESDVITFFDCSDDNFFLIYKDCLSSKGSLFFLCQNMLSSHHHKVAIDKIFGRKNFQNEIVIVYDLNEETKTYRSTHQKLYWYTKNSEKYIFHYDHLPRVPYMAPGMVTPKKRERGKTWTDVWFEAENLKKVMDTVIKVHSQPDSKILIVSDRNEQTQKVSIE